MLEDINQFEDTYQVLKNKKNSKIISFTTIILSLLIIFMIYFFFYPIKQSKTYYGTIINKGGVSYLVFKTSYISKSILNKEISKNLIIDNQEVNYEIVDIINNEEYKEVILKLQLNFEPRLTKLTFLFSDKTLFEKMKEELYE